MENYEPRIIISPENYDSHLLDLHRQLAQFADNLDPPNPFRGLLEEGDNIKIAINDTNDLHFCIKYFEKKILDGELTNVVIGDPHTIGYSFEAIEKMTEEISIVVDWNKNKDWIVVMLNTTTDNLVIEHGKIRVK